MYVMNDVYINTKEAVCVYRWFFLPACLSVIVRAFREVLRVASSMGTFCNTFDTKKNGRQPLMEDEL